MYKIAYVSGSNLNISSTLMQTVNDINAIGGKIVHIVQSQSTSPGSHTIVTVTIVYTT